MRISDIVNTVAAYQALGMIYGKAAASAKTNQDPATAGFAAELDAIKALDNTSNKDAVNLSAEAQPSDLAAQADDSLGSIIEALIQERTTMSYQLPGIAGVTGPINVTYQLDTAYHTIDFVRPRTGGSVDVRA